MLPLAALGRNAFVLHVLVHHSVCEGMFEAEGALHDFLSIASLMLIFDFQVKLVKEGAIANKLELSALCLSLRDGVVDGNFERFRQLALIQTQR